MSYLLQISESSLSKTANALTPVCKTVQKYGRKFNDIRRHFGNKVSQTDRVVYIYRSAINNEPDPTRVHPRFEKYLANTFRSYTPHVKVVGKQEISDALLKSQKIALAIPGGNINKLVEELSNLAPLIRREILLGNWNYLGISSGAVFAGHELKDSDKLSIDPSLLCLANFRASSDQSPKRLDAIPNIEHNISLWAYGNDVYKFKLNPYTTFPLEITKGCAVSSLMLRSSVTKFGEFTDEKNQNNLGISSLFGSAGKGKFFVQAHSPMIVDMDSLIRGVDHMCLKDGVEYILDDNDCET